jgi:hypothetical protein
MIMATQCKHGNFYDTCYECLDEHTRLYLAANALRLKHVGLSTNRLSASAGNPREVAFAKQWQKQNDGVVRGSERNTLETLIPDATQRDATVAATIIQWLGSNCGMWFIRDVVFESKHVACDLRDMVGWRN